MNEIRDIKYVNRTFSDLRNDLVELAKNYFPDTYNDFSPTSPGMMFMEMAAYVGDVLSFYQDTQLQETFLQYAKDPGNLYSLAYTMGYRPKVTSVSEVELEVTQRVDADVNYNPNWSQAFYIPEYSVVQASEGNKTKFLFQNSVDFTASSSYQRQPEVFSVDSNRNPVEYLLRRNVKAFSSDIITTTETVGVAEKFKTITISDTDIVGILDITDTEGDTWYEVPYLGQDTIFSETNNTGDDRGSVSKTLSLLKVPKRFVTRYNSTGDLQIQFGAGLISGSNDSLFLPNPENVGFGSTQGVSRLDTAYDPSNFLFTRAYGLAPSNTTLTIRYLKGGGISSNVPANTITQQVSVNPVGNGDSSKLNTITINNPKPASGGKDGDTIEEIRQNSIRAFSEQSRVVTLEDYNIRALSLPSRFGNVSKAYAVKELLSNSSLSELSPISLYVLGKDNQGKLISASQNVKNNLKTYLSQFIILTDVVDIRDAFIINIGVEYDILPLPGTIGRDVLLRCNDALIDYFNINKWNINQPINLSRIYTYLDRLKGVQSVQNIKIVNKVGGRYSQFSYDIQSATRKNIIYPSLDTCIFEVKFPQEDIKGRLTSL